MAENIRKLTNAVNIESVFHKVSETLRPPSVRQTVSQQKLDLGMFHIDNGRVGESINPWFCGEI